MSMDSLDFYPRCSICGEVITKYEGENYFVSGPLCWSSKCKDAAQEYANKKQAMLLDFAKEKEALLRPLREKLDMDLFLLGRQYIKDYK